MSPSTYQKSYSIQLSSDETFKQRSNELKSYLNRRGYNLSFLNQEVARVQNIARTQALTPKDATTANQPQRVPLVITYNPALRYVSSIINKHFNILSSSPRCTNVFKAKPFVAFRRSNNLSNCCGASVASEQQHKQDLRRIYKRENEFSKSSLFTRMLCGFYQNALRLLPECIAPRTTRGCDTVLMESFFFLRGLQLRQVSGYGLL